MKGDEVKAKARPLLLRVEMSEVMSSTEKTTPAKPTATKT
jgi:hypothetical protein